MTDTNATFTELDAATALFEVDGNRIKRIDMCMIPPAVTCVRSGVCPGLVSAPGRKEA